jgi:hypothetical protein
LSYRKKKKKSHQRVRSIGGHVDETASLANDDVSQNSDRHDSTVQPHQLFPPTPASNVETRKAFLSEEPPLSVFSFGEEPLSPANQSMSELFYF